MLRRGLSLVDIGARARKARPAWQTAVGAFNLIGIGVTVLSVSDPQLKTWAITALGSLSLLAFGWSAVAASRSVGRGYSLRIESTKTIGEFDAAWHMGNALYKSIRKHYPTQQLVKEWWEKYPDGILRLCDAADNVWGYLSMWPISHDAFQKLKSGDMSEDELRDYYISPKDSGPFHYWYIADVCRKRRPARSTSKFSEYLVGKLVSESFRLLSENKNFPDAAEVIAFAATTAGGRLMKKVGFARAHPASGDDKLKRIYVKTLTRRTIEKVVEDFRKMTL